jgi:MscS family membrane protein
VIVVVAVYIIFSAWNIDMTVWLASAGIIGIAVGFAAKDTLANLFSGVFILADAPYKIGGFVVLDTAKRGEVTHIGIRNTRLLTRDDVEITVPNSIMGNTKIINESGGPSNTDCCRGRLWVRY